MNSENTQNKEQMVEIEDKTYRLEEMVDAMNGSLSNSIEVISQQDMLIQVILSSDKANDFREFVKDIESQIDDMKSQNETLKLRIALLTKVIEACKANEEVAKAISMFTLAVGMFQKN